MKSSSHGQIQENRRETMMMNTGLVRLILEVVAASCLLVSVSKGNLRQDNNNNNINNNKQQQQQQQSTKQS